MLVRVVWEFIARPSFVRFFLGPVLRTLCKLTD